MKINSIRRILFTISILTISSSVISKEISYDYIQGGVRSISEGTDNFTNTPLPSGDGFEFLGSFNVMPNLAITAGYRNTEFDEISGVNVDAETYDLGVTAHTSALGPGSSAFANLSALYGEAQVDGGPPNNTDYDTGYAVSIGIRSMVTDIIELDLALSRQDLYDEHESSFEFAGRIYASKMVSFGAGVVFSRLVDKSLVVNARVDF